MAKKIENIVFDRFVNQPIPFEVISIDELYQRCAKSNYDLSVLHRIAFNALIIVTGGKGKHIVDFKEELLFPGIILPLTKGQVHAFEKPLKIKGFVISFEESFITQNSNEKSLFHFLQLYHIPSIHIGKENVNALKPYIDILLEELKGTNINLRAEFLHAAFMLLLLRTKRLSMHQHIIFESQHFKDFIRFKQLITIHYQELHNAKEYARKMGVSYKYLNQICKTIGSQTAKSLIDNWLLLEIKRNIAEKKYTSQEIAYTMGFKEHSNFIRFFKKFTGETPRSYQQKT